MKPPFLVVIGFLAVELVAAGGRKQSVASLRLRTAQAGESAVKARVRFPWTLDMFPDPRVNLERCGRGGRSSRVCDPEQVLSKAVLDREDVRLEAAQNASASSPPPALLGALPPCPDKGIQVYVAVVDDIDRSFSADYMALDDSVRAFANALGRSWGVLGTQCRNGIFVLYVVQDRYVVIEMDDGPATAVLPPDLARHLAHLAVRSPFVTPNYVLSTVLDGVVGVLLGTYSERQLQAHRAALFLSCVAAAVGLIATLVCVCTVYDFSARLRHRARLASCRERILQIQMLPLTPGLCGPEAAEVLRALLKQYPDLLEEDCIRRWTNCSVDTWLAELDGKQYRSIFEARQ